MSEYNVSSLKYMQVTCTSYTTSDSKDAMSYLANELSESVDCLCRDGTDAQYMQYLSKSFTTNMLKDYLST